MSLLEALSLGKAFDKSDHNDITNVSALNKCAWKSLQYLSLCGLKNVDLINLTRFGMGGKIEDESVKPLKIQIHVNLSYWNAVAKSNFVEMSQ